MKCHGLRTMFDNNIIQNDDPQNGAANAEITTFNSKSISSNSKNNV